MVNKDEDWVRKDWARIGIERMCEFETNWYGWKRIRIGLEKIRTALERIGIASKQFFFAPAGSLQQRFVVFVGYLKSASPNVANSRT